MTLLAPLLIFLHLGVPIELWSPILDAADSTEDVALLSVTAHEETGGTFDCARVGDQNRSHSCWQLMVFGTERQRVRADVFYAARLAMVRIRASLKRCNSLSAYLTGNCRPLRQASMRLARVKGMMR